MIIVRQLTSEYDMCSGGVLPRCKNRVRRSIVGIHPEQSDKTRHCGAPLSPHRWWGCSPLPSVPRELLPTSWPVDPSYNSRTHIDNNFPTVFLTAEA